MVAPTIHGGVTGEIRGVSKELSKGLREKGEAFWGGGLAWAKKKTREFR